MTAGPLVVGAAVIERSGAFLLTRRLDGTHLAGTWEFPGGKCEAGETLPECVRRELREELGIDVDVGARIVSVVHAYADRSVELHFFDCWSAGEPRPLLGQDIRWASVDEFETIAFPEADRELLEILRCRAARE